MFGTSQLKRVRQTFEDQFTENAGNYLYRKNQKGAPIRVSKTERDEFVAAFSRRIRYGYWSIFPSTLILILLLAWLTPAAESPSANLALWVGLCVALSPFMIVFLWAWYAPSRELQRRVPEGAALTREEARALTFSKITYGQLMLAALIGAGLIWKMSSETDILHGWGRLWLFSGGGLIAVAAVQAARKARFDRSRW